MHKLINNYLLLNSSIGTLTFKTTYSTTATKQSQEFNPELLALEHISSENTTTASVINNILLNQDIMNGSFRKFQQIEQGKTKWFFISI